jgi:hypothetical protein
MPLVSEIEQIPENLPEASCGFSSKAGPMSGLILTAGLWSADKAVALTRYTPHQYILAIGAQRLNGQNIRRMVSAFENLVRRSYARLMRPDQTGRQTMRVMVLVKATDESEKGFLPTPQAKKAMETMGRFNDELRNAGILLVADGLKPSSQGKRIAFDGPGRTVFDGPFGEARELVAGFWLWEVKDMDEAVAWAKRCPNPMPGPSEIEIRPLYEMADLL